MTTERLFHEIPGLPFAEVALADEVPVACVSEVRYAVSADRRRWVAKRCAPGDVVAEASAWLLAGALDVPVPSRVAVSFDADTPWWLAELLEPAKHWSEMASQSVRNPDAVGAIVMLDGIVGNEDRHAGNLLVQYGDGNQGRVVAIDFAGSWTASPLGFRQRGLAAPSMAKLARGISRTVVAPGANTAATLAVALGDASIASIAAEACRVARFGARDDLADALAFRCAAARDILPKLLEQLP